MRDQALWDRLQRFDFDDPEAELPFSRKLAEVEHWTERHARAVIEEYRKFLYLASVSNRQATPSKDIDRAWHLHLTYTRDYWDRLCGEVLGGPLHHKPGGGPKEAQRFADQYAETRDLYRAEFGKTPPMSVWRTSTHERYARLGGAALLVGVVFFFLGMHFSGQPSHPATLGGLVLFATGVIMVVTFTNRGRKNTGGPSASCGGSCGGGD